MNPAGLIDEVITNEDGGTAVDADQAARRVLLLSRLQFINNYYHNFRPWQWTYKEDDVTVLANTDSVALPTDFLEFTDEGNVHDSQGNQWFKKSRGFIVRARKQGLGNIVSRWFGIWDGKLQLTYSPSSATVLSLYYRRRPEVLVDDDTEMLFPDQYKDTVILPGLTARAQESKQDSRDAWFGYLREGATEMCKLENPMQTRGMRWPSAIRGGG